MTKLQDIIDQYLDYLSSCPVCKSTHVALEEKLTRISVFDYQSGKVNITFKSRPIVHYEFRCSACRHVYISETIDDGDWNISWTLLGDIFANKRMSRITAQGITKTKKTFADKMMDAWS